MSSFSLVISSLTSSTGLICACIEISNALKVNAQVVVLILHIVCETINSQSRVVTLMICSLLMPNLNLIFDEKS